MRVAKPDAVFAVHSNDERPRETAGTRHGVEESVRNAGLGVCGDSIRGTTKYYFLYICFNINFLLLL